MAFDVRTVDFNDPQVRALTAEHMGGTVAALVFLSRLREHARPLKGQVAELRDRVAELEAREGA